MQNQPAPDSKLKVLLPREVVHISARILVTALEGILGLHGEVLEKSTIFLLINLVPETVGRQEPKRLMDFQRRP